MVISIMKMSLIKSKNDKESFNLAKSIGMNVIELDDNERIDDEIKKLIDLNCKSIVISNEVAGFSEDIIKKYKYDKNINIYITPSKRK